MFHSNSCICQPKKELSEAAQRVGETSDWLLYRLRPDLSESQRTMRVNELASEVAVATAALGQTAKELTKETPQQKEHNGKVLGGALKVSNFSTSQTVLKQILSQVVHGTSRMVSTAKILAPVITDNACRDQLLVSLDDIAAAVDNFKNHAVARSAENKSAEKATESVLGAVADLVTYLKDSEDDPVMLARDDIVAACEEVLASKTAREAVKGDRKAVVVLVVAEVDN